MTLQQLKYLVTVADCKSMNKAAAKWYITQPSLSATMKDLENEIGIEIFSRTNRGIVITTEGEEFLGYARQMMEEYRLIMDRYVEKKNSKKKFSVSTQHYTFAVEAFISLAKEYGMEEYEFAIYETKTYEVIENVKNQKSEIGILYMNDFNRKVMEKLMKENELEFVNLFDCKICVYLCKKHPLANQASIRIEELEEYPCLSFEQGNNNAFYYAEEVLSTYEYKKIIKADDRATLLNLMVGMNGYTLCSGIICESLNGNEYTAVPLVTDESMTIGYIRKKRMPVSELARRYIQGLEVYKTKVL